MTSRTEPYPSGAPAWVDMMTTDRQVTTDFYGGLFGWEFEVGEADTGFYTMALVHGKPVAGFGEMPADVLFPVVWTTFLASDDLDESLRLLVTKGGKVLVPVFDTGGPGRGAVAVDPTGAAFGLWEAGTHIGAHLAGEPGSVAWHELATRDLSAAVDFYGAVFDLTLETVPDLPYTRLHVDGHAVGGAFGMGADIPEEIPSHWMAYFAVEDAEATVARARDLGGIPVGTLAESKLGRFATLGDPLGATFKVIQQPPSSRG
ncbi:VOC family protein [Actinosynnema sp. NPDC020468]|uniref:VOC family protein n=1 Tax=Actinosynnema sp. NPDC020468 TaxID=3154488 RepID=UPI00340C5D0D